MRLRYLKSNKDWSAKRSAVFMIIKNASVYTEDGIFLTKDIYINDNRFVD